MFDGRALLVFGTRWISSQGHPTVGEPDRSIESTFIVELYRSWHADELIKADRKVKELHGYVLHHVTTEYDGVVATYYRQRPRRPPSR